MVESRSAVVRDPAAPYSLETVTVDDPGPSEVLVRIAGVGMCHTDQLPRSGLFGETFLPALLGHEGSGVVEAVGPGVTSLVPGDHVVLTFDSCGACPGCTAGTPTNCAGFELHNLTGSRPDGTGCVTDTHGAAVTSRWFGQSSFGEYALATARNAVKVDKDAPLAGLGPLGCGVQTGAGSVLNVARLAPGQSIAVFCVGAVGLAAVLAAKLSGASEIIAVDLNEARRELALELGATRAVDGATPDLAAILTAEQGKPLSDSATEGFVVSWWLRYFADLELAPEIVRDDENGYAEVHRRPLGVVAAITPWNFPLTLAMWKIAPALRAGNTVVVKPSPFTPLATLKLGEVLRGVLPPGVLNVVTGRDPLGASLTAHSLLRKISFTGSTATGKKVAAAAADDLKRVTLELGGNDPAIVLPDADVGAIAQQLFWSGFINNGQTCLAAKRVYVHESRHDDLVEALAAIASDVKVDDGTAEGVQLGPVNNRPQFERVSGLVADAVGRGAKVVAGGAALDRRGYFYAPTILAGVSDGVAIVDEEQFGPVLPVVSYSDVDDAIARANGTTYGLTASVWSADPSRAAQVAAEIDAGQVTVNAHGSAVTPDLPFGGHKHSGLGVENGKWGLYGFTETQVLAGPTRTRGKA